MNTLLLRLSGAMQSWGVQSRFGVRDTGREPSKSGVIGLICAAMGIDRGDEDSMKIFGALRMGVRVEQEGVIRSDYHTAKNVLKAGGGKKDTELSTRYYLAGAIFLVGLESEDLALLEKIQSALKNPVWPLFLGRKAFVPDDIVWLEKGIQAGRNLEQVLKDFEWQGHIKPEKDLRCVIEDPAGYLVRLDQPLSFSNRLFAPRRLVACFNKPVYPVGEEG